MTTFVVSSRSVQDENNDRNTAGILQCTNQSDCSILADWASLKCRVPTVKKACLGALCHDPSTDGYRRVTIRNLAPLKTGEIPEDES